MDSIIRTIKKNWQIIIFVISLFLFFWFVWTLISVLLPFLIGLIIAYVALPLVRWLGKRLPGRNKHPEAQRISIIIGVYLTGLLIIAGAAFYMITVVAGTAALLWQNLPLLISGIVARAQELLAAVRLEVPASLLQQYDQTLQEGGVIVINALRNGLFGQSYSLATAGTGLILGFLSMPLVVFLMMKDWNNLRDGFFGIMPSWLRGHAKNVTDIIEKVMGRYIRGQIVMSIVIGSLVFILLTALGIEFAPALAVWAALMENIPLLGVWLSIIAGVAIALATSPDKALWLFFGYIVIQLIENNLLMPRVQGAVMKMSPILIILVSVIGAYLAGLAGFIIAVPVAATGIELLKYFRSNFRRKEPERKS